MPGKYVFTPSGRKWFLTGIIFYFIPNLVHTYFLMPFPGSMTKETMWFSYNLDKVILFFTIPSAILVLAGCLLLLIRGRMVVKTGGLLLLIVCGLFYYAIAYYFNAEKMFREPGLVSFKQAGLTDYSPDAYILGVTDGRVSKAYPVKYLAYHHKIMDTINGKDIMVTYCSMCRTARVFTPYVEGKKVRFRLVGARHYNAVIEDSRSGTWWYQATGEAAAGPLKGKKLQEVPSEQTTWRSWVNNHPGTYLLHPDPKSTDKYEEWFSGFDKMRSAGTPDSISDKTWVVGVHTGEYATAYPFPELVSSKVINDQSGTLPVAVVIEKDSLTTHVWNRSVNGLVLDFTMDSIWSAMFDQQTASKWTLDGLCISGFYKNTRLEAIQHYHEYLRSWKKFHPGTRIRN